jgi:endonuclease/exonuclease/phosphatase family metal-dependent hydrolase
MNCIIRTSWVLGLVLPFAALGCSSSETQIPLAYSSATALRVAPTRVAPTLIAPAKAQAAVSTPRVATVTRTAAAPAPANTVSIPRYAVTATPRPAGGAMNLTPHLTPGSAPRDLRVMSFNLRVPFLLDGVNHWGFRKNLLVDTILQFQPDVLGTQECVAEQGDFLQEELPDYTFLGVGRDDGKRKGEMTGVMYRKDRFREIDHGYFWLSSTPNVPGSKSWGAWFTRMCTWVKLQPLDGSTAICVFNVHLDNMGARSRVESALLLRRQIASIAPGMPVVVTGDFNADAGSKPYRALLAALPGLPQTLVDAFRVSNPKPTREEGTHHDFHGTRGGSRIDWILVNSGFSPISVTINHAQSGVQFPSDHFPVQAILRPAPQGNLPFARLDERMVAIPTPPDANTSR